MNTANPPQYRFIAKLIANGFVRIIYWGSRDRYIYVIEKYFRRVELKKKP